MSPDRDIVAISEFSFQSDCAAEERCSFCSQLRMLSILESGGRPSKPLTHGNEPVKETLQPEGIAGEFKLDDLKCVSPFESTNMKTIRLSFRSS